MSKRSKSKSKRGSKPQSYGGNVTELGAPSRRRRRYKINVKDSQILPITISTQQRRNYIDEKIRLLRLQLGIPRTQGQSKGPIIRNTSRTLTVGDRYSAHDVCAARKRRRAVLLAAGKVNKPGGAPGPYKPQGRKC